MNVITQPAEYHASWIANFFHAFPHVDLKFKITNSTFLPNNTRYQEVSCHTTVDIGRQVGTVSDPMAMLWLVPDLFASRIYRL